MPYEFGEIVLVRFPFTNQATFKQRPAVVVSSHSYNLEKPDVIIAAVTSQIHSPTAFGEVLIAEWQTAKLLKPSAIKPVLAKLEQSLILKTLGVLHPADQAGLRNAIAFVLG